MRVGDMEGTPQEINDFCENNGLNIEDYLEKPEKPLNRFLFIAPSGLYIVFVILLTIVTALPRGWRTFVFLLGCCCSLWLAVNIQIRFNNTWATAFIIIGGIAFMLVALGVISPLELLEQAKELKQK
jgi:hypothetical protein